MHETKKIVKGKEVKLADTIFYKRSSLLWYCINMTMRQSRLDTNLPLLMFLTLEERLNRQTRAESGADHWDMSGGNSAGTLETGTSGGAETGHWPWSRELQHCSGPGAGHWGCRMVLDWGHCLWWRGAVWPGDEMRSWELWCGADLAVMESWYNNVISSGFTGNWSNFFLYICL